MWTYFESAVPCVDIELVVATLVEKCKSVRFVDAVPGFCTDAECPEVAVRTFSMSSASAKCTN